MGTDGSLNTKETKAKLDYLKELLTDRTILASDPHVYIHLSKILEQEILRIRSSLFSAYGIYTITENELPEPEGPKVNLQTKVYMPTDPTNSFNFVGRILGPDGSTAKCLQQCLGVKIMVRGRGSMRDRKKEEANTGKPNWEHLNENLHVVLTVEDYENRAKARLAKASEYINLFLQESMKGSDKDDKVKQMQLMELSFRREPRLSWHFNCNGLFDVTLPPKHGALYPNAATGANLFGFGYGYAPASLFSPLHHNSHHHHHHFGSLAQPPSAQQQQQAHGHSLSAPGPTQHNHLAGLSHPLHANLGAVIMGHGLGAGGYNGLYSPTGHTHASVSTTTSLPGGPLAMAQMNYWSGQSLSQLPPEYGVGHAHIAASHPTANGYGTPENNVVALTNGTPPSQHITRSGLEDTVTQCLIPELSVCTLNGTNDLDGQTVLVNGLHSLLHGSHNHQGKLSGNNPLGTNSSIGGTAKHGLKPRYSQKHASQTVTSQGHTNSSETSVNRNQGRSAVVTVKVVTNDRHQPKHVTSMTNSRELSGSVKELNATNESNSKAKAAADALDSRSNSMLSPAISASLKPLSVRTVNSDVEWPTLGSSTREKSNTDLTAV